MIRLAKQGVFWTIQGEGYYAGEPMIFIRLAGCSVGCPTCDTNYSFDRELSEEEIVENCVSLREKNRRAAYVWVTGGEPTDQPLELLSKLLWSARFRPCIATSGFKKVEGQWWWISVSPHSSGFIQRSGAELKLVPGLNGLCLEDVDLSDTSFAYRYVQPMAGSRESLDQCLEWLKHHAGWTMSPQYHKQWVLP